MLSNGFSQSHALERILASSPFEEEFCNRFGSLRVARVRKHFGLVTETIGSYVDKKGFLHDVTAKIQKQPIKKNLGVITDLYKSWRDFAEYIPIKINYSVQKIIDASEINSTGELYANHLMNNGIKATHYQDFVYYDGIESEWHFVKCCKRGNDVYINEVKKKFKPLIEAPPKIFFDTTINKRKRQRFTNVLYVTATINQKENELEKSWLYFGKMFNKFITNIRKQFGEIQYLRSWQSQENGFPHWHGLFFFKDFDFSAVPNWDFNPKTSKRDKLSWRIASRQKLHKGDKTTVRQRLKQAWKYGGLDIICIANTQDCFKDLLKYVTRELEGGESDLTNAIVWFYGKQSFALSKGFAKAVVGETCIDLAEPSNADLKSAYMTNSNPNVVSMEIYPIVPGSFLKVSQQTRLDNYKDPTFPPPEVVRFLELLQDECNVKMKPNEFGINIITYTLR